MPGINNIFEIGKSALFAQQTAINTTGQNISNVNTEGYSRKVANFEPSISILGQGLQLGSGVTVNDITRVRDRYIDSQLSLQRQTLSYWETMDKKHLLLEQIYEEPGETGISGLMNSFFESWYELSNNPDNAGIRDNVIYHADALAKKFNSLESRMTDMSGEITNEISDNISDFNDYAAQIAEINKKVLYVDKNGGGYSSLLDERDMLLEKMNSIADIVTQENELGQVNITLSGKVFLQKTHFVALDASKIEGDMSQMNWTDGTVSDTAKGGTLGALIELREDIIPENITKLNNLAATLVETVNNQHRAGYSAEGNTGVNFFDESGTDASTIAVDARLFENNQLLAASGDGNQGDGTNAMLIAQLQDLNTMQNSSLSFTEYYANIVTTEGNRRDQAIQLHDGQETFTNNLYSYQQSISGVSLDEEMTNLILFQRGYQAASKLITLADEMTQTIINMV